MTTYIFGCVEEENSLDNTSQDGNGDGNEGMVIKAMDVEITNIEYEWSGQTTNPLDTPEMTINCEAINYGGPGRCTVEIKANCPNSSITMKQIISLNSNEQKGLQFWGKIDEEPLNITSHVERTLSNAVTSPKSEEMDVVIANIFPKIHGWLDVNQTELKVEIFASVINYEQPGYITLVVKINGEGFNKTLEERIHVGWYELQNVKYDMILPGVPVNTTITTKRPQPD
jgi:hypothetical protein